MTLASGVGRIAVLLVLMLLFGRVDRAQQPPGTADPISGTWGIGGRTLLDLTLDGTGAVTGTAFFTQGETRAVLPIRAGSFELSSGALKLEGDVTLPGAAGASAWVIQGTLDNALLRVAFTLGASRGELSLTRLRAPPQPAGAQAGNGRTVLITGSNRGLGLEFVRQYAAAGWNVIATARHPDSATDLRALAAGNSKVVIDALDLRDTAGITALAASTAAGQSTCC
jgi:hypothetical protein